MSVISAEEHEFFEREVSRFLADSYDVNRRRELIKEGRFGNAEWKTFAELGWLNIGLPEKYGGLGGGLSDQLTLLRAAGKGLLLEPLTSTLIVGAGLISLLGNEQQKNDLLPQIGSGELTIGFANTPNGVGEPDSGLLSSWNADKGCFTLSGVKRAVLHGKNVDQLLVTARNELDGTVQVFLVAPCAKGMEWHTYRMIDDQVVGDIDFHTVAVAQEAWLNAKSFDAAFSKVLAATAIAIAAESVGAMESLNEMTLEYVKVRKQFGKTLGSFQVLQHRIVDMMIAAKKTHALVKMAASTFDHESSGIGHLAATCKVIAAKAGRFVGEQSIQIHGGIGMTDEYMAGHYLKRLLLLGAHFGDADYHLRQIATTEHSTE